MVVVYALLLWWVDTKITHRAIGSWQLRAAVAAPLSLLLGYAIWSGSIPLTVATLALHASVILYRLWRLWGVDPPFVAAAATTLAGLNVLLVWMVF